MTSPANPPPADASAGRLRATLPRSLQSRLARRQRALGQQTALLALLQQVTAAANQASRLEDAAQTCLIGVCDLMGWPVGHLYLREGARLVPSESWHLADPERYQAFRDLTMQSTFQPGEGLIGRVAAEGRSIWVEDVTADASFKRRLDGSPDPLRAAFAFPILTGHEVAGVLEFLAPVALSPQPGLQEIVSQIGIQLGRVIERRYQTLDALKTYHVHGLAHDMRTPLMAILGHAELLAKGLGGPLTPQQATFVAAIRHGGQQLQLSIDALMDLALLEHGGDTLPRIALDLRAELRRATESLAPLAMKAGVTMRLELPETPLRVKADPFRIGRVLANLVQNALKFTPRGGLIQVRATAGPWGVRCEVRDTGVGIALEDRARLFQPFSQLMTEGPKGGSGLGLSICKAIIEAHGGTIGVDSAPGEGSTFWFALPGAPDPEPVG